MRVSLVFAVVVSCLAGFAVVLLPLLVSILAAGVAAMALVLVVTRAVLTPSRSRSRHTAIALQSAAAADSPQLYGDDALGNAHAFTFSRRVYYLGVFTIGFLVVRPAFSFTLSDWLFLASLLLTIVVVLRTRTAVGLQLPAGVICGAALFAVGGLISSTQAINPVASTAVVFRVLYLIIPWFWLGTIVLRTSGHVLVAVNAWVMSAAISGLAAVVQFLGGDIVPGGDIAYGRATGLTGHFNDLGGLAAVSFVPALMLAVRTQGMMRAVNYCALALVGAGLLFSGSVGALLAASASTAVWLAAGRRARPTVLLLVGLLAVAILFARAEGARDSPSPLQRVSRVTQADAPRTSGGTLYSRIDVYRSAWDQIARQPLVGVGLDAASSSQRLELEVHNIILLPWFTAGILGITGILVLLGSLIHTGLDVLKRTRDSDDLALAISLHASFVAFLIFGMSEPVLYVRYGWVPAALLLALRVQYLRIPGSERTFTTSNHSRHTQPSERVVGAR